MRRWKGRILMGLAVVAAVLTALWIVNGLVAMPRDANEDQRTERNAAILLAGAMLAVETALFFLGRWLHRYNPSEVARMGRPRRRRRWLLAPYLLGSLGLGALAAFLPQTAWRGFEPLRLLVCQPHILVQIIGGGILGIKLKGDEIQHVVTAVANLLYFPILLYPLYRILTMDPQAAASTCTLMKVVLGLFISAHILITLFLLVALQA
ncbi:MAG TPA: hypothetical protein PLU87_20450 [Sedimentisphaerales bacterium]|nr:hypothetical protein [Sedimentisphaerales bacterium]HRS13374.1 hypothetical protein [Sedimentisphaerales bacterium]HRV50019.1 hypothetical protein [Sedimentisphaerales bacterium]